MAINFQTFELPGGVELCVRVDSDSQGNYFPAITAYFPCGCMYKSLSTTFDGPPAASHQYTLEFMARFTAEQANEMVGQCRVGMAESCKHAKAPGKGALH